MKETIILLFLFIGIVANGQNTVSPYSIFGPGEIQNKGFGATQSLGGAGITYRNGSSLNNINPASYTSIDSSRILVEFGIESKLYNIYSNNKSQTGYTGNLNYVALGFKYTDWIAGSFGIVPFSSIGYSIAKENYIEGMNSKFTSVYTGSGGINQFYFGNAIKLLKNLSIGINVSYMFGPLFQYENISQTEYVPQLQIVRQDFLKSFYLDYGLQYYVLKGKTNYSLGLVFSNKQKLKSNHILSVYDGNGSVIRYEEYNTKYVTIPMTFGAGLGINKQGKYNLLLDYNFQKWSGVKYPNQYDDFINSHSFSLGLDFKPWEYRAVNPFYKNWEYRVGLNYKSSYLKIGNEIITGESLSFGAGIPLPSHISKINLGIEIGSNGTESNHLIQEKYILFNIGLSLNEIAFLKRKYD